MFARPDMQAYPSFQPLARCLFRQKLFIQTKTRKSIHLPSFPTVLLRRTLFLRKHHPMDYPPFCLALRSLSSSLLYWLYCDVRFRSCCTCCAFSRYRFNSHWKHSFRNLPLNLFIYYLISAMIRKRTVPSLFPSCTFPVSESDYVGFLFVRRTQWTVTWSFKISDAVIHHFSLCTQLRKIFNCNCFKLWLNCFRWRMYLPFLFLFNFPNVCWQIGKIWESTGSWSCLWLNLQNCSLEQLPSDRSFETDHKSESCLCGHL